MQCETCGARNRRAAKFCASCGEKLGRTASASVQQKGEGGGRRMRLAALGLAAVIVAAAGFFIAAGGGATPVVPVNGLVRIPLAEVSDGKAHYFSYDARGTTVRFFVLQAADGVVRAALDTCDVCFKDRQGYRQEGDVMVCNKCDNRFPAAQINVLRGGCNPVPLERKVEGRELVLNAAELDRCAGYFQAG